MEKKKYTVRKRGEYTFYENEGGPVLGVAGAPVVEEDGLIFKDLARAGRLLPYEDWRLGARERAEDLVRRLSLEEMAGLMLYSSHQLVPFRNMGPFAGHYDGREYQEGLVEKWALTDEQKRLITADHIRHVLLMKVDDGETSARWSNELQRLAEGEPWGIPVNISSDPRHGAGESGAEYKTAGKSVSRWPEGIGMTATHSEELWRKYGEAVSAEYRAMGITTALGPQIDLATEPRWMRYEDTFGGDLDTSLRMTRVICDAMQTTEGTKDGWGRDSVAVMVKHWPGGGTGEGGRDAHYGFGKFAVYPGENFESHRKVFTEGALKLEGPTGQAASIMPYYTVSWGQDRKKGENVGNSYSEFIIRDLLRDRYGYDGVICTDWGITGDQAEEIDSFGSRSYGVEELSVAERHLRIIMNGVDQFGGNNEMGPILEACGIGSERYGKDVMRRRMEESAARLLTNLFRLGLFENPYLDPEKSGRIVGSEKYRADGMEAQRASVVLLKNRESCLPLKKGVRVYIPDRVLGPAKNFFRVREEGRRVTPVERALGERYFLWAERPEEADAAIVFVESPQSDPYDREDRLAGGNGYRPISLQYRPYRADAARSVSIAGGDFREASDNRSYQGKTGRASNEADLDLILETKRAMGDKPVIVCVRVHNPAVMGEFEREADGILAEFGVSREAVLDVIFGDYAPTGRLPMILPKDMETVERHCEDVFEDIEPYQDEEGHSYRFGYGLEYKEQER